MQQEVYIHFLLNLFDRVVKSIVCNNHRNIDHKELNYLKAFIAGEKAIS